jgi:serine/threonine-protein kinase
MRLLAERAVHPNVVRLLSWGRWPHPRTGRPYLIMDWVPGLPVDTWAETRNPTIRQVLEKFAIVAVALDSLHDRQLLHRDLKPEHLLIRETDGRPMMIDFGVGWYEGAEPLTTQILAPGTAHLRSPESVRFWRTHHNKPGARYVYTPADDLYALSVSAWRVLTGHWPFPPHMPRDLLFSDIETQVPPAAMEVNRRLPRPISDAMHRMLAKDPAERFPNGWELHMHWVAALAYAGSAVDVELFSWEPVPETELKPEGPVRRIRRPEWPTQHPTPPAPRPLSPPGRPEVPQQQAPADASSSEQSSASALTERERLARRRVGRSLLYVGLVGVGLVVVAALSRTGGEAPPRTENNLPAPDPTPQVGQKSSYLAGQKLAVTPERSESDDAAVPPRAEFTPATVVPPATQPQKEPVVKNTPDKPKTEQPQQRPGSMSRKLGVAACAATMACASAPVRHLPPNEPCPPETIAFMKKNRIRGSKSGYLSDENFSTPVPVKEGPIQIGLSSEWPRELELSGGFVTGQLFFGPDGRVYGYLRSLVSRNGAVYPYCGVIKDKGDLKYGTPALGEMTDTARIDPVVGVTTVHEFFATF